jgi:hypothetical protein
MYVIAPLVWNPLFSMTALCGGAFSATDSPQTITSPSYPRPVGQDLRCRWTINTGDSSKQIRISFMGLNLISDNNCSVEYIELRDSPLVNWILSYHAFLKNVSTCSKKWSLFLVSSVLFCDIMKSRKVLKFYIYIQVTWFASETYWCLFLSWVEFILLNIFSPFECFVVNFRPLLICP